MPKAPGGLTTPLSRGWPAGSSAPSGRKMPGPPLPAAHRTQRRRRVVMVRRGDDDGVERPLHVEHLAVVVVLLRVLHLLEGAGGVLLIDIADRDDVLAADTAHVAVPLAADTDAAHVELFVRRLALSFDAEVARPEARAGDRGRRLQEASTTLVLHVPSTPSLRAGAARHAHQPRFCLDAFLSRTRSARGSCAADGAPTVPIRWARPGRSG